MGLGNTKLQTVHVKRDSRVFRVGNASSIENLHGLFEGITKPFVLLLAADATKLSDKQILHAAEQIIPKGLTYFCAWDPIASGFTISSIESLHTRKQRRTLSRSSS